MDCSLPGSSIHGIFQAKVLEWVAISFSRRSSQPRNWTWVSCIVGKCFTVWATREVRGLTEIIYVTAQCLAQCNYSIYYCCCCLILICRFSNVFPQSSGALQWKWWSPPAVSSSGYSWRWKIHDKIWHTLSLGWYTGLREWPMQWEKLVFQL